MALGTECAFHLCEDDSDAGHAAMEEVLRLEHRYSGKRPDNYLAEINAVAARGGSLSVDEETADLLDCAFAWHRTSGGLFDVTVGALSRAWNFSGDRLPAPHALDALLPLVGMDKLCWRRPVLQFLVPRMELDLRAIVKRYAADRAAEICEQGGVHHGILEVGGDFRVVGPHTDGAPWLVRPKHPRRQGEALATLSLSQGALATSGDFGRYFEADGVRYCDLLDPKSGWPVAGLQSVSVEAETCLAAGGLATAAMLMGKNGPEWLHELEAPCLWRDANGTLGGSLLATL